ncbi:MAG: GvpL/GvpF family gas vesicle protein [Deltaproteobacteria bacterium]|nr:GvpL/GvpF family gas vesicle protein [Deltaproteobacteria bacterium]
MYGKYVYGIIIGNGDTALGVRGMVGTSLVYNIAHEGLSCVVSDYAGGNFDTMSKEELARCLVMHQVVDEQVMKRHSILPVKFGTVLETSDEVSRLLTQGHPQFYLTLLWMQDKVEVEVMASWAGGQVIEENGAGPEMLPADEPIPPVQIAVSEAQRPQSYLERMIDFLQPVSVDIQYHPPKPGEMAVSAAFLVEKANLDTFHSRVNQLNALYCNQINFQVTGPLPPYSFVMVEVIRPSPEAIHKAKLLLNLDEVAGEVEVRKAYRRLAALVGSDRKLVDKLARARLMALRRASDLLVAYCRGQTEKNGGFLISIRRSRSDEVQPPRLAEIGA